jgi:hypothetical protein
MSNGAGQMYWISERWAWIDEQFTCYWMGSFKGISLPVLRDQHDGYGAIDVLAGQRNIVPTHTGSLYLLAITSIIFLWVAQLLFCVGLIGVMSSV